MPNNNKILSIVGPTGIGKTALALALAKDYPIEVVSLDSVLVYRGLDIGAAKPSLEEQRICPHHLIDIVDPDAHFSVAAYIQYFKKCIAMIQSRNNLPVVVGGSMMYAWALMHGLSNLPSSDLQDRQYIAKLADQHGWPYLWQQLHQLDPASAQRIAQHDQQRISRALEVVYASDESYSSLLGCSRSEKFSLDLVALWPRERATLYDKLNQRFVTMLETGLIKEVEQIQSAYPNMHSNSPINKAVGYRQVSAYLRGELDHQTMLAQAQQSTRNLAKRQLTWLRKMPTEQQVVDFEDKEPWQVVLSACQSKLEDYLS